MIKEELEKINKEYKEQLFDFDKERTELRRITHRVCKERRRLRRRNEELKKENAELKKDNEGYDKDNTLLVNRFNQTSAKLIKAKEIIRDFISVAIDYIDKEDKNYSYIAEAETFLKG